MPTFRLTLEYDGTEFAGWQSQKQGERTVQDTLAAALAEIAGQPVRVSGAGRTDAGVHAEGQVAAAAFETRLDAETLARALNAKLPTDVAVVAASLAADGFDPRREARGKLYRYALWNGSAPSPLRRRRFHHVREPLDVAAMAGAATALIGRHDFASFRAVGSRVASTTRTLERAAVDAELAGAQAEGHAGHRGLATAGRGGSYGFSQAASPPAAAPRADAAGPRRP